jgi:hypothetical protein
MFDPEELLTHEEILLRFKKIFNRDMTAAKKHAFFLPSETATKPDEERLRRRST